MHSEKNTGLRLACNTFTPLKVGTAGTYWDPDFQNLLRDQHGSNLAGFFPRAEVAPGGVLFSMTEKSRELTSDSRPLAKHRLPPRELDRFIAALLDFQKMAGATTPNQDQTARQGREQSGSNSSPPPDPTKLAFIKTFRLPDPDRQPESYRLAGSWFNPRLIVLWGYHRQPDGGSFPAADPREIRRRLLPYVNRYHSLTRMAARLLQIAAATLLICMIWAMFRSGRTDMERRPVCQETLTAAGACLNLCPDCGEHLRSGQCPNCRPRGQHLTVAPRQAIMTGDIVTAWADQPGVLGVDGMTRRQVASPDDKVHCRFPVPGDYAVTWEPDSKNLNGEFVRLSVRAPVLNGQTPPPFQAVLLLTPNPAAPGQTVTATDASFTDLPGRSITTREIQWGEDAPRQPLPEAASRSFPKPGHIAVTLLVMDNNGTTAFSTVDLIVTDQPTAPAAELALTPTSCHPGEIVLARDLTPNWSGKAEPQRDINWGDDHGFTPMPDREARHVFTQPGNYQVTLRLTSKNGRVATASGAVDVQAEPEQGNDNANAEKNNDDAEARQQDGRCRLRLAPDIALAGEPVIAADVSALNHVYRRQVRWTIEGDFEDFTPEENALVIPERQKTFTSAGHFEVTLKLTMKDQSTLTDTRHLEIVRLGQKGLAPRQPVFAISSPDVSDADDVGKRLTYTITADSNADVLSQFQIDVFTVGGRPAQINGHQASIVISTGGQHDVRAQVTYQTADRQTRTITLAGKQLRTVIEVK